MSAAADDRVWVYGNSTFRVEALPTGDLTILFAAVGNGLDHEGVVPGTPLFQGTGDGVHLSGHSAHFRKECGPMNYDVSGLYDLAQGVIFLSGRIPVRNQGCHVEKYINIVMKFEAPATAAAAAPPPRKAPPAAEAAKPEAAKAPAAAADARPPVPAAPPAAEAPPPAAAETPAPAVAAAAPPPPVDEGAKTVSARYQQAFCSTVKGYADTLREWKRLDGLNQAELTAREQMAIQQKQDPAYRLKTMRQFSNDLRKLSLSTGFYGWSGAVSQVTLRNGSLTLAVTVCPDAMKLDGGIVDAHGYALFGALPAGRGVFNDVLDLKVGDRVVFDASLDMTQHKEQGDRLAEIQQTLLGARYTRVVKE